MMTVISRRQLQNSSGLGDHQRGGIYITLLFVIMLAFCVITGTKLAPSYIDNKTIITTLETIDTNEGFENLTLAEIRRSLNRTLITNGIRDFDEENIQLVRENNQEYIDVNYENRIPIAYNVEALVVFNKRFDK